MFGGAKRFARRLKFGHRKVGRSISVTRLSVLQVSSLFIEFSIANIALEPVNSSVFRLMIFQTHFGREKLCAVFAGVTFPLVFSQVVLVMAGLREPTTTLVTIECKSPRVELLV